MAPPSPFAHPTVLVVDDDVALAEGVRRELAARGFAVRVAHDGRAALDLLFEAKPHLVISDVMMPHVDGIELALMIHASPALRDVPVVLMSSLFSAPGDARGAHAAFLRKPFGPGALVRIVEQVLGRVR